MVTMRREEVFFKWNKKVLKRSFEIDLSLLNFWPESKLESDSKKTESWVGKVFPKGKKVILSLLGLWSAKLENDLNLIENSKRIQQFLYVLVFKGRKIREFLLLTFGKQFWFFQTICIFIHSGFKPMYEEIERFGVCRGGVRLEFVGNSFILIQKFAIRWIQKGKKYSKNWWKLIQFQFVWFNSNYRVESHFQKLDLVGFCSIRFENLRFK